MALRPQRCPYFRNDYCYGLYFRNYDCVIMRNGHISADMLRCMLHELCHAIQEKEGRYLPPSARDPRALYALELEADVFARLEYRKLYERRYGPLGEWDLAEYSFYKRTLYNSHGDANDGGVAFTMSANELYSFVKCLKGSVKKPIVRVVRRAKNQGEAYDWELQLRRICI